MQGIAAKRLPQKGPEKSSALEEVARKVTVTIPVLVNKRWIEKGEELLVFFEPKNDPPSGPLKTKRIKPTDVSIAKPKKARNA